MIIPTKKVILLHITSLSPSSLICPIYFIHFILISLFLPVILFLFYFTMKILLVKFHCFALEGLSGSISCTAAQKYSSFSHARYLYELLAHLFDFILQENLTEDLDQVQGSANPQSQETENNEEVKEQEACPDVELAEEIITLTDEANAEIEVTEVQHVEEIEEGEVRPSETLTELTDEPGQINSDIIINEDEKEAAEDIHTEVEDKLPESLPSKGAENTNYILENNIENEDE